MKRLMLSMIALAVSGGALFAQELAGTWQGTLSAGGRDLRIVMILSKEGNAFKGMMHSIDQPGRGIAAGAVTLQGAAVKVTVPAIGGTYEGKLNGDSINGTWTQGPAPMPLNMVRATAATAWTIPEPPPPPKAMAADANPSFEVATIKPSNPDTPGKGIRVAPPRRFFTINTTLSDIISFVYGVHPRQITGAPSWVESEKFDLDAKFDTEGMPNEKQLKTMVQKLLAERFKLAFHRDKKELSAYAITVGKTGPKLTKSEGDPNGLPGLFFSGLGRLNVRNANIADLASLFQSSVLDRPVVDQTSLAGRFDYQLNWTPDEFQFGGAGARAAAAAANQADAPPNLFTAIQEQLGLKLEATKAPVDVLVIDKAEKPSEN